MIGQLQQGVAAHVSPRQESRPDADRAERLDSNAAAQGSRSLSQDDAREAVTKIAEAEITPGDPSDRPAPQQAEVVRQRAPQPVAPDTDTAQEPVVQPAPERPRGRASVEEDRLALIDEAVETYEAPENEQTLSQILAASIEAAGYDRGKPFIDIYL